jgi:hypothetical protein
MMFQHQTEKRMGERKFLREFRVLADKERKVKLIFRMKVSDREIKLHESIVFRPDAPIVDAFEIPIGSLLTVDRRSVRGVEEDTIKGDTNSYDAPLVHYSTFGEDGAVSMHVSEVQYFRVLKYTLPGGSEVKVAEEDRYCWIPQHDPFSQKLILGELKLLPPPRRPENEAKGKSKNGRPEDQMEIYVWMLDGESVSFDIELSQNLGEIKELIADHCSVEVRQQLLFFNGTLLTDNFKPLSHFGVQDKSELKLKMKLFVKTKPQEKRQVDIEFAIDPHSTIENLKGMICDETSIATDLQLLMWDRKVLDNDKCSLLDFGIPSGSTVQIFPPKLPLEEGARWYIVHENFEVFSKGIAYRKMLEGKDSAGRQLFATNQFIEVGRYKKSKDRNDLDFICPLNCKVLQKYVYEDKRIDAWNRKIESGFIWAEDGTKRVHEIVGTDAINVKKGDAYTFSGEVGKPKDGSFSPTMDGTIKTGLTEPYDKGRFTLTISDNGILYGTMQVSLPWLKSNKGDKREEKSVHSGFEEIKVNLYEKWSNKDQRGNGRELAVYSKNGQGKCSQGAFSVTGKIKVYPESESVEKHVFVGEMTMQLSQNDLHETLYIRVVGREDYDGYEWLPVYDPYHTGTPMKTGESRLLRVPVPEDDIEGHIEEEVPITPGLEVHYLDDELTRMLANSDGKKMTMSNVILDINPTRQNTDNLHFKHLKDLVIKNNNVEKDLDGLQKYSGTASEAAERLAQVKQTHSDILQRYRQEMLFFEEGRHFDEVSERKQRIAATQQTIHEFNEEDS